MSHNSFFAKTLRFIGIVLMALTGGFTLLGGVGTTCAALFPTKFGSMTALASFQWLYILFVIAGVAIGVWGIWATVKLVKGASDAYTMCLQALTVGAVVGFFHIYMSRMLRGNSMPVDAVVYTTVLTLVVFLLFRIPFIWSGVDFEKSDRHDNRMAGGAATSLLGIMTLTIQYTMAGTHTWNGINYADAFNAAMTFVGPLLILGGAGVLIGAEKIKEMAASLRVQRRGVS
ncbi:MAG: hypothetical protein HXY35_16210 [Chloroflexi bacterium]|nr:hypothetical protein [Chloroflexota bacterium]